MPEENGNGKNGNRVGLLIAEPDAIERSQSAVRGLESRGAVIERAERYVVNHRRHK